MTIQTYLIIESNIVTNAVAWDGNVQTWTPPADSIQVLQETTPAMVWVEDFEIDPPAFVLTEMIGVGTIGFTWNGTVLTTNEPKPELPVAAANQPTTGLQTA